MQIEAGAPSLARSEGAARLGEVVARFADADDLIASHEADPLSIRFGSDSAVGWPLSALRPSSP
jgi:hypothetical protein